MKIITLQSVLMRENCYIISDKGESAVIDPGINAEKIISASEGTKIKYILLTHGHFDHIIGVEQLKKSTGAKVYINEEDAAMLSDYDLSMARAFGAVFEKTSFDVLVNDDDEIKVGSTILRVIATPGHSRGSVCYYGEGSLFSGDTLFRMTIGVHEPQNTSIMKKSIEKLLKLPDDTNVYPGHNESTTIGFEKNNNPYADTDWEWI